MTKDSKKQIIIKGAKEHNLQNIDLAIPRDEFIVITGLSGSGKSSLAFDTIYAEGQRRYVESLSAYARQFLGQMKKPEMEYIEGILGRKMNELEEGMLDVMFSEHCSYAYSRLLVDDVAKKEHCKRTKSGYNTLSRCNWLPFYRPYSFASQPFDCFAGL